MDNIFTAEVRRMESRQLGPFECPKDTWNLNAVGAVMQNFDTGAAGVNNMDIGVLHRQPMEWSLAPTM